MRRGLSLLKAFRPGFSVLTNGALAELSGLAPSTVSRMTGALVEAGLLRQLPGSRGYAPTAACISLGFAAFQALASPRQKVLARMEEAAERHNVSVSLAAPDGDDMVYVDTFRRARRETLMHIAPGVRIPMTYTALGTAALACMPADTRAAHIAHLVARHTGDRAVLRAQIAQGVQHHQEQGWCQASWVADVVGVARAVHLPAQGILSFNCAGSSAQMSASKIERKLVPLLFELTELATAADEATR
uniref:IclR family transcriptional regulator n=1 Tax=uncultured Pseudacidovorax sp. TaxID=679313 RepID=UPI0025D396FA|nr:helix-turn-helix domain-containing protein [Pseudacidovorax intermedius]